MLISFLCSMWCCVSLRVSQPDDDKVKRVFEKLQSEEAQPGELCHIVKSEGEYYNGDDKYDLAEEVFKDEAIDSLEVLKCFVETMKLTLNDAFGEDGETLLFPAVKYGHPESAKYLIAHDVPVDTQDVNHWTAAMTAVGHCATCLDFLLNKSILVSEVRSQETCTFDFQMSDRCTQNFTLAHFAAKENDLEAMKVLNCHNFDFNAIDSEGWNPAHVAVRYDNIEAFAKLENITESPWKGFNVADKSGRTPAHLACQYVANATQYFEIILRSQGDLGAKNSANQTPAHICASARIGRQANPQGLEFLYAHANESFEQRDSMNRTPAEVAQAEKNPARLFFANLKAKESEEKAKENAKKAKENEETAHKFAQRALTSAKKANVSAKEQERLVSAMSESADKCQDLSNEVKELLDCDVKRNHVTDEPKIRIRVPRGIMIASSGLCPAKNDTSDICAMRCPNPLACPKRHFFGELQCGPGYDEASVGCSRCLETHGRHRQDPFLCKGCASPNLLWLSWLLYAMKPLGIYSVTLWTAQKVEKDKLASLLKIWMSFGVVVACISPSIQTSKTVTDVAGHLETGAASGEDFVSIATQLSGPSFDCLLGTSNASMTAWLLLSLAPALALWVLSMIYAVGRRLWMQAEVDMLMRDALKVSIAITNCFLPDMVAALSRYFPCIHFQSNENYPQFLQYSVEIPCSDAIGTRIVALFGAVLVGALGPLFWVAVIKKSDDWTEKYRKETLGFLVSGYRPQVYWWEATVLIRKCVVALAAALFSVSYAPMLYLSSLLLIVGLSLAGHAFVQPYQDKFLNRLEFGTLVASFVAVFCTFILKLEALDWATDRAVTAFAFVILFVVVTVPGISLIALYFNEILKRELRLDILGTRMEEDESPHPRSDAST